MGRWRAFRPPPITGSSNVGIGYYALSSLQGAGASNTAIGYSAAYNTTATTTGTENVYIGADAHGSAGGNTNEIAIGYNAAGNGSNTITLGNSSNIDVYHYGTLYLEGSSSGYVGLVSPASPTSATYTLPTGVPGTNGYVLSGTTTGVVSWVSNAGTASTSLSSLTAAAHTILNTTEAQVWEWALTGQTGFTFGESTAATGGSKLVDITTLASSTAVPLTITNGGTSAFAINMSAGGLAIGGTNVIDLPDADTFSIAVGENALKSQGGTSLYNTAVGFDALTANTSGAYNTAIGLSALNDATTANPNTAVGFYALFNTTGGTNTALGYDAGQYLTTGAQNLAIGYNALLGVSATPLTGSYNTAVGGSSLYTLQGGASNNIGVGYGTLNGTTAGSDSTAIGVLSLDSETGGPNDALGYQAGEYITSGASNVTIGYDAMNGISATPITGSFNTVVGNTALFSAQGAAAGNVAIGYEAGYSGTALTTGTNNVYIGYEAHGSAGGAATKS
jgi:trimeric autotransporter adhesin